MSWDHHAKRLEAGETIQFRPNGNSMQPKIESGQLVTVEPIGSEINAGDIVLCKVRGNYCLHLVKAVRGDQYQIGNNKGHINGWITDHSIYGKCIKIED